MSTFNATSPGGAAGGAGAAMGAAAAAAGYGGYGGGYGGASKAQNVLDGYVSAKFDRNSHTWVQKTTRFEERDGRIIVRKEVKVLR